MNYKIVNFGIIFYKFILILKEGLKSLFLDRNFDGVFRCKEGFFWSGWFIVGEIECCLVCWEIIVWNVLFWKRFIFKGVTVVFLCVFTCVVGCFGVFGFRFILFIILVFKFCFRDLK